MKRCPDTEFRNKKTLLFLFGLLLLQAAGCDRGNSERNSEPVSLKSSNTARMCNFGDAVETNGHRRLALIVGVGRYKNEKVPDLDGPPNDAERFYSLLTRKDGYGFPEENVCLLLNEEAS
ncbi:MAG: caspase family protein, partial [bacterium]|nr:caspase family protein [bacterium]